MIIDDVFKMLPYEMPPATDEEAIARVSNLCSEFMHGVVLAKFKDVDQLRRALAEVGWNSQFAPLMASGPIVTYKGLVLFEDGSSYKMIVNQVGTAYCQVVNCALHKEGDAFDHEGFEAMRELLKKKSE